MIICRHSESFAAICGFDTANRGQSKSGTDAKVGFVRTGEVARLVISQARSRFLDGGAIAQ